MPAHWTPVPHLLRPDEAATVTGALRAVGRFRLYSEEGRSDGLGAGLPERYDLARQVLARTDDEQAWQRATRLNVFRETLATADSAVDGRWRWFRDHPRLRELAGGGLVEPVIVYANAMLPGMELAVHDDVPAFRGLDRETVPQWLLCVMRRSGLFARWHIPTVHVISWWSATPGGDFLVGRDGDRLPSLWNRAVVGDFEAIPHGVDRVGGADAPPRLVPGGTLQLGRGGWSAQGPDGEVLARFPDPAVRFSLSWRARVHADAADAARVRDHSDDLTLDAALRTLTKELRERGILPKRARRPRPRPFAKMLVEAWPDP